MLSPHHPAYRCTARKIVSTFRERVEVEKVNREMVRLLGIRDEQFNSEFGVGKVGNGRFMTSPSQRTRLTVDVTSLRRRKMLLLNYIKRTEALNAQIRSGAVEIGTEMQVDPDTSAVSPLAAAEPALSSSPPPGSLPESVSGAAGA
eukprot:TRINITY_DN4485_c0_g2_i1.p1 TRINITY_DN4485_c0_g2~~TRINITY_DN4485_c0_g2_i1.p1  ORF type:complete len:146 (+),score=40.73 TRINITY_DN4485_c0_g2_i1:84-521(+)